ncbi:hypothetical protein B0H16DRAFT_659271, partial [Mycena metata]
PSSNFAYQKHPRPPTTRLTFDNGQTHILLHRLHSSGRRSNTSFINAPGCFPDEVATVVSESIYPVVLQAPPVTGEVANLTLTFYTCPSRQADGGGDRRKRQSTQPVDICGIMDSSAVFESTFTCAQSSDNLPTLRDCGDFVDVVTDNLIRPLMVTIPARSGLAVSLFNNTCAFAFLNDDFTDDYETCLHTISDMDFDIEEECPPPF